MIAFLRMPRGKDESKTLGELGVLGANLFRFGEQTRAKGAKRRQGQCDQSDQGPVPLCLLATCEERVVSVEGLWEALVITS